MFLLASGEIAKNDIILAMRISVLVMDGVIDVGLASILDAFQMANVLDEPAQGETSFEVQLIGMKRSVTTRQGLRLGVRSSLKGHNPEVLVIPGLNACTPEALLPTLAREDVQASARFAACCHQSGSTIATACTGTFVVAESGILNGKEATTTWWLAPLFRKRYPLVHLEDARMVVQSGKVVTAGAALGHLDLALSIIRRQRPALACSVAKYLVIEPHRSEALFAIADHLAHEDPIVERFEKWARRHSSDTFSLSAAARAVSCSERTLSRRTQLVLGKSPLQFVQSIRVERALHQIRSTTSNIDEIAQNVGYGDGNTLRTLIRRETGFTVRHIRELLSNR